MRGSDELKSMRGDLKNQISALSEHLKDFQRNTNARLEKIESVICKLDEIDVLTTKQKDLEKDVEGVKASVDAMNATVSEMDSLRGAYTELQKKLEHLERYSRDYNIRVIGVDEESDEECMSIVLNYVNLLGLEDATGEVENAHHTGRKREDKPRRIIAKLYSRPFKRTLLQTAKSVNGKEALNGVRFVEDFIPSDFSTRKKALPLMQKAFEEGKRVLFTKGKLFVDGNVVPVV